MKEKAKMYLVAAVCLTCFVLMFTLALTPEVSAQRKFYSIATATTGGTFYPTGVALAQLYSEKLGSKGIKFSAQTSAGSVENVDLMRKDEAQITYLQSNVAIWAYEGSHMFQGKAYKDVRMLFPMFASQYHIIVRGDIKSIRDIRGKRFVVGRPGSGTDTSSKAVLEAFGITYNDIKADYIGQAEAINALKNRQVDGALLVGGFPISAVADLMASPGIDSRILPLTNEELQTIHKKHPWIYPAKVPAGTYMGQKSDIPTASHAVFLMSRNDLPEDLAYQLVKLTFENLDWLRKAHGAFKQMSLEGAKELLTMGVPLHPGATKYYREKKLIN
jgi:TRAP transporter TAXI family solute receptor